MNAASPALPACCSPLQTRWLLPRPLAGVQLVSTRFDPARLDAGDFPRWGLAPLEAASKRQAEYLAGRVCAHEALRLATGTPGMPATGADRAPLWPAGATGSITHGAGFAAALAAPREEWLGLGLDVERRLSPARADRLAGQILTPGELRSWSNLDEERRALLLTLTFSLKESLFKALYPLVQRRFYFHDAELLDHDEDGQARLRLLTELSPQWRRGAQIDGQFQLIDEHLLSLASIPV